MLRVMLRRTLAFALASSGCAARPAGTVTPEDAGVTVQPSGAESVSLADAEAALASGDATRAVALFAAYLRGAPDDVGRRNAYLGLAHAHELLRDCAAAIRAYDEYVARFGDGPHELFASRGACQAELELTQPGVCVVRGYGATPDGEELTRCWYHAVWEGDPSDRDALATLRALGEQQVAACEDGR